VPYYTFGSFKISDINQLYWVATGMIGDPQENQMRELVG
jgi:hypothetical protein